MGCTYGLRDPAEPCTLDARNESPSPTGDEGSHLEEDRGNKEAMGLVAEEGPQRRNCSPWLRKKLLVARTT